jgi:DNA-binding PadR family transcriptional regulator
MTPGTSARGGRSRRVFTVTADGARTLTALQRIRDRLYRAGRARPETARS